MSLGTQLPSLSATFGLLSRENRRTEKTTFRNVAAIGRTMPFMLSGSKIGSGRCLASAAIITRSAARTVPKTATGVA
jgi:hypothetical protein